MPQTSTAGLVPRPLALLLLTIIVPISLPTLALPMASVEHGRVKVGSNANSNSNETKPDTFKMISVKPPRTTEDPRSPQLSSRKSNLYEGSSFVSELLTDPISWDWDPITSPPWAIVFYAPWCGHCQRFAPIWEAFAKSLASRSCNGKVVHVGAVNCNEHDDICDFHNVKSYPTVNLFWGPDEHREPYAIALEERVPSALVSSIEHHLQCNFVAVAISLRGSTMHNLVKPSSNVEIPSAPKDRLPLVGTIHRLADAQRSMQFGLTQIFAGRGQLSEDEVKGLLLWLRILNQTGNILFDKGVAMGLRLLLEKVEASYRHDSAISKVAWKQLLLESGVLTNAHANYDTLGSDDGTWVVCNEMYVGNIMDRTTSENSVHRRGYTCGLWMLFHFLAEQSHIDDARKIDSISSFGSMSGGQAPKLYTVDAIVAFVRHFFGCKQCRDNFLSQFVSSDSMKVARQSKDHLVEWLWRAHNSVNARLRVEEGQKRSPFHLPFPDCEWCLHCCRSDQVGPFAKDLFIKENALKFVKRAYCVDRQHKDFSCSAERANIGSFSSMSDNQHGSISSLIHGQQKIASTFVRHSLFWMAVVCAVGFLYQRGCDFQILRCNNVKTMRKSVEAKAV